MRFIALYLAAILGLSGPATVNAAWSIDDALMVSALAASQDQPSDCCFGCASDNQCRTACCAALPSISAAEPRMDIVEMEFAVPVEPLQAYGGKPEPPPPRL